MNLKLLLKFFLLNFAFVSCADYACTDQGYTGQCYDCLYNDAICHRAGPSTIYTNGNIYTVDQTKSDWHLYPSEAMVVTNGKIDFVGTETDANTFFVSGTTREVNLKGNTILPGIHDVHMHPLEARSLVGGTCALPANTQPNDPSIAKLFNEMYCQGNQKGTDWILGHGHSVSSILDYLDTNPAKSPKEILDELVYVGDEARPAIMMEETSHSVWVNSKALEMAGIDNSVENKDGSIYMRDANNNLNGILLENAGIAMMEKALDITKYPDLANLAFDGLKEGLFELAKHGITSAVDARNYWQRENEKAWKKAADQNILTAKVILSMWAYPENKDDDQIAKLKTYWSNNKNSRLRQSQIKVYMDGLIGTRSAVVIDEYKSNIPDLKIGNHGVNYFNQTRLEKYLKALQNLGSGEGYDFLIHAVGDGGVRQALNAIEASNTDQAIRPRHKISHVEMIHPDDLDRFNKLGVIADPQVAGDFSLPTSADRDDFVRLLGTVKAEDIIPVKSLLDNNAKVTLSSDWDVSTLNPFIGMSHAINRGKQSVNLKDAVEMYTINGAYSMKQEEKTGSLEVGKDADFIVIDKDIFKLEGQSDYDGIKATKVLMTVLEGEEIWVDGP